MNKDKDNRTVEETPKNTVQFLKTKDANFSMFTASNRSFSLTCWMNFMDEYARLKSDQETASLKQTIEELRKENKRLLGLAYDADHERGEYVNQLMDCKSQLSTLQSNQEREWPDFGDYAWIEHKRYGAKNEFYQYKVIRRYRSNRWIQVPVSPHNGIGVEMEDVVACICCGVCEEKVEVFRLKDVLPKPPIS